MPDLDALDRLDELLGAKDDATANTSMRISVSLREAAVLAVERLNLAGSTTELTSAALRRALETALMEAVLNAHYEQQPKARPSLAEVALALAAQDASPLAEHPEIIERAAAELLERHPNADPDDVLLWAEAQQAAVRA